MDYDMDDLIGPLYADLERDLRWIKVVTLCLTTILIAVTLLVVMKLLSP